MSLFYIIVLLCLSQNIHGYQVKDAPLLTKRPAWMRACRRSDPDKDICMNKLFAEMFPQLAVGIPEMNVDRFEPLPLDEVTVSKGAGPIILAGSLYDLMVVGPSNSTPMYTELDLEKKTWNFGVQLPLLKIKSLYNLKGRILVLPLVGHGPCNLRLKDTQTKVTTNIELIEKEGREIIRIANMNVSFTVGEMKVKFQNLFNGNKVLGQTVNAFVNQHAQEIISELQDSIGESLAKIFTDIVNNVYTKMPTDLWLLSDEEWEKYEKETSFV